MQFIANGPDVPDSLLEAHEEGRVVFFIGAGISYPAKLPGFKDLVKKICDELGATFDATEQDLFCKEQYDRTLDSLERRLAPGRIGVRRALANVLTTDLNPPEATRTHTALLELARTPTGQRRLVTTNFDRIFEHVIARDGIKIESYAAPMLPIPKASRWDGLVYLHGLLTETPSDTDLHTLIATSGDFGLAYLIERWAARFVSELLRNFVVCFVGYSINDPILRYMMDALAADRLQGETTQTGYAFGSYKAGERAKTRDEWVAKGVEPVLYEDHDALHQTLIAWADMHRDGALGKEAIVAKYASYPPQHSTKEDDFVGRVVWAICDPTGMPARCFAELTPPPPLSWLGPLDEMRFGLRDLSRFDLPATALSDAATSFSVLSRPTPSRQAPTMRLAHRGETGSSGTLDKVMHQLSRWLVRHLDSAELIIWVAERGPCLHPVWRNQIQNQLRRLEAPRTSNIAAYNAEIEASPGALPGPLLRPFWDLLLAGRVRTRGDNHDNQSIYAWRELFKTHGMSWVVRARLREHLAPKVTIHRPYLGSKEIAQAKRRELIHWELILTSENVRLTLKDFKLQPEWCEALPSLLPDFGSLLMDALSVRQLLSDGEEYALSTDFLRPSISEHSQNPDHDDDWTVLIDLVRDAWLELAEINFSQAGATAVNWWTAPYALFKRLALFAARYPKAVPPTTAFEWVRSDEAIWLWDCQGRREVMPWLRHSAPLLDKSAAAALQALILAGPPASLIEKASDPKLLCEHYEEVELIALLNLRAGEVGLTPAAQQRYEELTAKYPEVILADNHREEFTSWIWSGPGHMSEYRQHTKLPRDLPALIDALRPLAKDAPAGFRLTDDWCEICSKEIDLAYSALATLADENVWPAGRWQEALSTWAFSSLKPASPLLSVLAKMPDSAFVDARQAVSDWLRSVASDPGTDKTGMLHLCRRVVILSPEDEPRPLDAAINHPVGKATDAALKWWLSTTPQDNQKLPTELVGFLSSVIDGTRANLVNGRVLIASNIVSLFRADAEWATKHFLPSFDWESDAIHARAAWAGFLSTLRGHRPMLEAIKPSLLATVSRYEMLGNHGNAFVDLLLDVALELDGLMTREELTCAFAALPQSALDQAANLLARRVRNAGDPAAYWRNRVQPFLRGVWPKDAIRSSPAISKAFALLCIWAASEIRSALSEVEAWLKPVQHSLSSVLHELNEGDIAAQHPSESLTLLDAVTDKEVPWISEALKSCLSKIGQANGSLQQTPEFLRLAELVRRYRC